MFINVLQSFAHHMPLAEPPDLAADWELLYERSIGCVGILKQWLIRALSSVLRCGKNTIARRDIEARLSQCCNARRSCPKRLRVRRSRRSQLRRGGHFNADWDSKPAWPATTPSR
jgi:hypothetical protein